MPSLSISRNRWSPLQKSFTPVFEIVPQVGLQLKIYYCLSLPGDCITDIYHHKQLSTTVYYFVNANFRNCILTSVTKLSYIIKVKFPKMKDWNAVLFLFFQDRTWLWRSGWPWTHDSPTLTWNVITVIVSVYNSSHSKHIKIDGQHGGVVSLLSSRKDIS